ncbi:hypothetical protein PVBG_03322 [Plasmodium vivax Brazil I]|uniref:VIR protein n=1 Tax=Plasmodium vivax (strain Brazil I) TaxID=1033975 RepID=A0A0J9SUW9_PLAV1|nr:hypothetical protein PVBG_03322 [Plasmodium vivax Brazil I]
MAKPSNSGDLENALKNLKLDKLYEDFFEDIKTPEFKNYCDVFDSQGKKKNENAKKICPKIVYLLEKIYKMKDRGEGAKRCGYLRYWLYDEVGKIHTGGSISMDKLSYIADLIEVGNKVNKEKLKYTCSLSSHDKNVKLDEWKNRKLSYIYIKKYDDIKKDINPTNKDKCNMYTTYLNNMNSLYNTYKKEYPLQVVSITLPQASQRLLMQQGSREDREPRKVENSGNVVNAVRPNAVETSSDAGPVTTMAVSGTLETLNEKSDKNFIRNIVMATAILGTIFFLFYYNLSSRLKSSFPKRKRKKKIFEQNYYEEYEKELEKYDSEDRSLASEDDRYYLNYQPEGDYDY